jgi:uncharacterized protein
MREIDVRDLMRHPGASKEVRVDEPVGGGLALELATIPGDEPVHGQLLLESVVDGILVTGPVSGSLHLRCARCLKDVEQPVTVEVQELFAIGAGPDDDDYPLDPEGSLDPEPMIRDALILAMPFSPLCRPDCLGICERCGGDRNLGECSCSPETADPRWGALDALVFEVKNDDGAER